MVAPPLPYRAELKRKALHLLALVVPLGMWWLGREVSLWLLAPAATVAVMADVLRARSVPFAAFIQRYFGAMMRPEETPAVPGPIRINGATWVLVTAFLLALLFPLEAAVPAFVVFMLADAAAALFGRRFGRFRWPRTRRTVEGSLAFVVTGLAVLVFFPHVPFWTGALCVGLCAFAEALPGPLNDNLRVPLVGALVLMLGCV